MDLKAIETRYKGYKFRSRLEARWAVFFDAAGLKWEYETEGFQMGNEFYLPDFKIEGAGWVEIKPSTEMSEADVRKMLAFSSQQPLVVVCGSPWPGEYSVLVVNNQSGCFVPADRQEWEAQQLHVFEAARSARFDHTELLTDLDQLPKRLSTDDINAPRTPAVSSGFLGLDEILGGLRAGHLVALGGRASIGKSAFACNVAANVAMVESRTVLYVSLESSRVELADRMLMAEACVSGKLFRQGLVTKEQRDRLRQVAERMSAVPLYIDDRPSTTIPKIRETVAKLKAEGLRLMVIDNFHVIDPENENEYRERQLERMARALKVMAREFDITILCSAQLSRQQDMTKDPRPRLGQIKGSDALEQEANAVLFIHRPAYFLNRNDIDHEAATGKAEVIVAKNSQGPIGDVNLVWQPDFARFVQPAMEWSST